MMQFLRRDLGQHRAAGDDVLDELLGAGIVKAAFFLQPRDRVLDFRAGFDAAQTNARATARDVSPAEAGSPEEAGSSTRR